MDQLLKEKQALFRTFAEEISVECFSRGFEVDLKFAEYFAQSAFITFDYTNEDDREISKEKQEAIIKSGIEFFTKGPTIEWSVLRLQTLFACDYVSDEKIINDHNKLLFTYVEPLMQFVSTFQMKDAEHDYAILYRKIVLLVGLIGGLSDPSKRQEYEINEAALSSIMNEMELPSFLNFTEECKRQQIIKLSQMVVGIRLFNRYRRKGGGEIVDLPKLLKESINATKLRFNRFLTKYELKIASLSDSLDYIYKVDDDDSEILYFEDLKEPYDEENLKTAKYVILLFHQMVLYLRKFLENTEDMEGDRNIAEDDLNNCLTELAAAVDIRAVVPVDVVYPKFYEISLYWNKFQNMIALLSYYNKLIKNMDNVIKKVIANLNEFIKSNISRYDDSGLPSGLISIKEVLGTSAIVDCEILFPDENQCMTVPLEYNEFCPVNCCEYDGMLYKADRYVGVLKYRGNYYGFRDCKAAAKFGADPECYITKVLDFAKRNMLFMDILEMRSKILKISPGLILVDLKEQFEYVCDEETQTDVHPIEKHYDPDYRHSIWQWRNELKHMATLLHYRTHACQTVNSVYRSHMWTQTYTYKDAWVQTMADNYTQVPTISKFIFGTRGEPSFPEPQMIHLTRPITELPKFIR